MTAGAGGAGDEVCPPGGEEGTVSVLTGTGTVTDDDPVLMGVDPIAGLVLDGVGDVKEDFEEGIAAGDGLDPLTREGDAVAVADWVVSGSGDAVVSAEGPPSTVTSPAAGAAGAAAGVAAWDSPP